MKPVVVTMVTDPAYAARASKLLDTCQVHGLECEVIRRPDRGTWIENVAQKPSVIRSTLQRLPEGTPVLWIDADATVERAPALLYDCSDDLAIRKIDRRRRTWQPIGRTDKLTLPDAWEGTEWFLTGTVYVANNHAGRSFIDRWCELAKLNPRGYQQLICQRAWCDVRPRTLWLPTEYCAIGRMDNTPEPVISHELASCVRGVVRQ